MKPRPSSAAKPVHVGWKPVGSKKPAPKPDADHDAPPFDPDPPKATAKKPPKARTVAKPAPKTSAAKPEPDRAPRKAAKDQAPTQKANPSNVADTDSEKLLVLRTNESGKTRIVMVLSPQHRDASGNVVPMLTIRQQYRRGTDPDWLFSKSGVSTPADEEFLKRLSAAALKMAKLL